MAMRNIVDVHSHAILGIGAGPPLAQLPDWSVEGTLAQMDRHGIDAVVLSVPDAANYAQGQAARDIARRINEKLAEVVQRHPRRFGAMVTLPGRDADGAVAEIAYGLDTLKLDGVCTSTNINDSYLGEPQFDPWFEEMNRRSATLFIHPMITKTSAPLDLGLNASVMEFMFDTTRMVANLVTKGAKQRFGDIKMISTHAGGTIPFLARRVALLVELFGIRDRPAMTAAEVREGLQSFYFDLTAATTQSQLVGLLDLVPASHLLFGFDMPFMPDTSIEPAIDDLCNFPQFDAETLKAMSRDNALRLYPALAARLAHQAGAAQG